MKARSKELLERSLAAMLAAIEIYNKPNFTYRSESFTILAVNARELLLKAKWLQDHKNVLSSLYVRQGPSGGRVKKTSAGNAMTHGLTYLANKLCELKALDDIAKRNLAALTELRDSSVHLYDRSPQFAERVQEIGAATVKNFNSAAYDWFRQNLSKFNLYLMPLAFVRPPGAMKAIILAPEEKRFEKFIEELASTDRDPESRYSVTVNVELRFVKSMSKDATAVKITNDLNAPAVRLTDDQIRARYPLEYFELIKRCKERYEDFKVDKKFHNLRDKLRSDPQFTHTRYLDPTKPLGTSRVFHAMGVIDKFDSHYRRKSNWPTLR
jgi:hypothetical protein